MKLRLASNKYDKCPRRELLLAGHIHQASSSIRKFCLGNLVAFSFAYAHFAFVKFYTWQCQTFQYDNSIEDVF